MGAPSESRAALVTGGSSGIGLAVAQRLLDDGWGVTICGRSADRLAAAAEQLGTDRVHTATADVTDADDVAALLANHDIRFGRLDALVHSAGMGRFGPVTLTPATQLDQVIAANLRPVWTVTAAAAPQLVETAESNGAASVVALGSILGAHGRGMTAAYSASKAGLRTLMESIHDELQPRGVRASLVAPAYVDTPMTEGNTHLDRDTLIQPDDVASTVLFLIGLGATAWVPEIQVLRAADRMLTL